MKFSTKKILYFLLLIFSTLFLCGVWFGIDDWIYGESWINNYTTVPTISISHQNLKEILINSKDYAEFYQQVRILIISQMVEDWFDRFVTMPYNPGTGKMVLSGTTVYPEYPDFVVKQHIVKEDSLDVFLRDVIVQKRFQVASALVYGDVSLLKDFEINVSQDNIDQWNNIFLFKNNQDLHDLGYVVSTYRIRTNNDPYYRRRNIFVSLRNMGNVRVMNIGDEFSFLNEARLQKGMKDHRIAFTSWYGNIGGIRAVSGGGMCGASTSLFQTVMMNKGINILESRNHTRHYYNLYNVDINGKNAWTPGLDIAVYAFSAGRLDLRFVNHRDYPIVLVSTYDGEIGWIEEAFTLWKTEDRGDYQFVERKGNCFIRSINGEELRRCYAALIGYNK